MRDISIVIPARNAARTLLETLGSVLAAPEVGEVIVVDDGSTDDTALLARGFGDARIRVIQGPKAGVAAALNAGFAAVTLPFVARCDADDLFPPDRLAWQRDWLSKHPEYIAISGGFATLFSDGGRAADLACEGAPRDVTAQLLAGEPVTHFCAWLVRAEALGRVGGARSWFATAEDVDLQFRLAEAGCVWHEPRVAYFYRLHDASITHSTDSERVAFYASCARRFALERRQTGQDSLQRGCPPVPPAILGSVAGRQRALDQAAGHVIAAAWQDFNSGCEKQAWRRLLALLVRTPFSRTIWWHVMIMKAKRFRRLIFH